MANALTDYFEALERLKKGLPRVVPKGTKITNDAVSLEAGRGKGTIKKSRPIFADLIAAIDEAAAARPDPQGALKGKIESVKCAAEKYRGLWEEALAREASLLMELYEAKKTIGKLTGGTVLPIRGKQH
ncbi:hypothetical protein [Burkholderia cepacia]|uniref:hypothetical protein n=1 Tax=Burkholderia cepacia TaxID=292 RepID=UPI002AB641B5|nr:hypothetical protein [Burkholderia cepacia]